MTDSNEGYVPEGPLDPVAATIAEFFQADPSWQALTSRPIAETRAAIRAATPVSGEPAMDEVADHLVEVRGGEIALRLYRPVARPLAIIVWVHGGGFALGSLDETDNFAHALAARSDCAVASVEYRLAPEHKFPTAIDDLLAATRWVAAHREELAGADVSLVLGGDSAGANLATVVTRKLHASNELAIAGNVLAYPCTDSPDAASLRRFASPFLGAEEIAWFIDQYLPDRAARTHPDFAPIHATGLDLLPPTMVITAEHDVITEQAEAYGGKLAGLGVDIRSRRYAGMIHGFLTMDAFFPGAAGAAMGEISEFIADVANR